MKKSIRLALSATLLFTLLLSSLQKDYINDLCSKFDVTVTRIDFWPNKSDDYAKSFKLSEGVFSNIKIQ